MAKKEELIELQNIEPNHIIVEIEGDTDLIINKMNDVTVRELTSERKGKAKKLEAPNKWEEIITSVHWLEGKPDEFTEETFKEWSETKTPCITAFGLKKSFGNAVVRNKIDTYATKFDASVNICVSNNLVPITFTDHVVDEKLMSPKKGAPVLSRLNRFTGWKAEIPVSFIDNVFGIEQIINIINLAGFGIGIGSGRSSGYGRYHVTGIK